MLVWLPVPFGSAVRGDAGESAAGGKDFLLVGRRNPLKSPDFGRIEFKQFQGFLSWFFLVFLGLAWIGLDWLGIIWTGPGRVGLRFRLHGRLANKTFVSSNINAPTIGAKSTILDWTPVTLIEIIVQKKNFGSKTR